MQFYAHFQNVLPEDLWPCSISAQKVNADNFALSLLVAPWCIVQESADSRSNYRLLLHSIFKSSDERPEAKRISIEHGYFLVEGQRTDFVEPVEQ